MKSFLIALILLFSFIHVFSQDSSLNKSIRHKIAVFTPLYLDEAFNDAGDYRLSGKTFPKNSIAGLEFYHGTQMAIDSLKSQNVPLDIYIYDSRSNNESLAQQLDKAAANGVELIIANCSINELNALATIAQAKKITVINATVPNDGNTKNNPYFIVLNPTLQTQIEGIYNYIKNKYPSQQVVFFTNKNSSEVYIKSLFDLINKANKSVIPVKYIEVADSIRINDVLAATQNTPHALFLAGTLDLDFANHILKHISSLSKNFSQTTIIGMPTWENLNLSKYKDIELVYSTPFYNPRTDAVSRSIISVYNKKMYARPSDLVFRAFALTYKFGNLLNMYGKELGANLNNKLYRVFYDYDIEPVFTNHILDYFENKKLYFLKYLNGSLKEVN